MKPAPRSCVPALVARRVRRPVRPGLVWIGVLACWPLASAAEEPLRLGSEHIGMTAEGMSETAAEGPALAPERPAAGAATGATQPPPTEWTTGGDPWAPDDARPPVSPAAGSYDECVELAIQSGSGFRAASGVCQALFPEPVAPSRAAQQPAPAETPVKAESETPLKPESETPLKPEPETPVKAAPETPAAGEAAPDDGPLVLTLDGRAHSAGGSGAAD